jgi:ABC-2 type transport system permease protein
MNTQSNAAPETPLGSQGIAPEAMRTTRPLYWSIRRELWENRSIYIAPLAVAGVTLFGYMIASIGRALSEPDLAQRLHVLEEPFDFSTGVIMVAAFIVAIFYSLDALHGERRDRSILFWKSLPVSDVTTVLSKASIPLLILPLLAFAIVVVTQIIMVLLSMLVLRGSGLSAAALWTHPTLLETWLGLLYHLVTVHILWHAPLYAWLILVSAWARRATFLWALLPPVAIGVVEKIAFGTSHFFSFLLYRLTGGPEALTMPGNLPIDSMMTHLTPLRFLSTPGLWLGLIVAVGFFAAAARLRRSQGPI